MQGEAQLTLYKNKKALPGGTGGEYAVEEE
jgi:hypothetical protein